MRRQTGHHSKTHRRRDSSSPARTCRSHRDGAAAVRRRRLVAAARQLRPAPECIRRSPPTPSNSSSATCVPTSPAAHPPEPRRGPWPATSTAPGVNGDRAGDRMADGADLDGDEIVEPVAPVEGGGQPEPAAHRDLPDRVLECRRGDVVALVGHDQPVAGGQGGDVVTARQRAERARSEQKNDLGCITPGQMGVRPAGFEPATRCLEGSCSVRLSYGRLEILCRAKVTRRIHQGRSVVPGTAPAPVTSPSRRNVPRPVPA